MCSPSPGEGERNTRSTRGTRSIFVLLAPLVLLVFRRPVQAFALAGLCAAAYACSLNNGFISDDYANLQHAETVQSIGLLFQFPPLNFRITSFLVYFFLQKAFGGRYEFFYAANIFLHFLNCLLLWKLLVLLGRDTKEAYLAAALFAVFQAPQEAVMWSAAMKETLLGLFVLITLALWLKGRYVLNSISLLLALFSQESTLIAIPIVLLM